MKIEKSFLPPPREKWVPNKYMKRAVAFLKEHAAAALFLDPGARKTSITLKAFKDLKEAGVARRMLVIAPLRPCYRVWPPEIEKWLEFEGLTWAVLHGPKKEQALTSGADVCVINPEGLEWLLKPSTSPGFGGPKKKVDVKRFKALGFDTLIIDELTKFKHPSSQRFKMLKEVLGTFSRRWGLTGSPRANRLMDLFGQCYILDQGAALGQFITHFRSQYFIPVGTEGWDWRPQRDAEVRIYQRIAPLCFRFDVEDYLELPEIVPVPIWVDLPPAARKTYEAVEDDLFVRIGEGLVTAANSGVASMKARQVASGAVFADAEPGPRASKREVLHVHDAKLDALESLIEELAGAQLLVGYDFTHDMVRMKERFDQKKSANPWERDVPWIGGGVSPKRSEQVELAWNAGEVTLLLGHPQSMGHGLNLQESQCCHVAWFSLTWDYELYDQFIRRVRRSGHRGKRVFVHPILARKTVDEVQWYALKGKQRGQEGFFEALKEYSKVRRNQK